MQTSSLSSDVVGVAPGSPDVHPSPGRRATLGVVRRLRPVVGFVVLALVWEVGRWTGVLPRAVAPSVSEVLATTLSGFRDGELIPPLVATFRAWGVGLAAAVVIGLPLGLSIGVSRWVDVATRQVVEFLRPIPAVTLIPVGIVAFGLGMRMQYFLVAFACVWPIVINARYGARNVDPLLLDSARAMGCGGREVLWRVVLPSSMPAVATGARLSATMGVIVAVATEMVSGSPGLGRYIIQAQNGGAVPETYAGVLVATVFAWIISLLAIRVEKRFVTSRTNTAEGTR